MRSSCEVAPSLPYTSPDVSNDRQVIDIFLSPGDFFFGDADTRVRTVLGSCIAVTLWHPVKLIGGMCHYMLPTRGLYRARELIAKSGDGATEVLRNYEFDGRYGDEAIELFLGEIKRARTVPADYEVKLFGGGNMFPETRRSDVLDVGRRNIELGLALLKKHRFRIKAEHTAGVGHRNVLFEIWNGDVWLKHAGPTLGQ